MKFVVFNEGRPGILKDDSVIDVSELVRPLGASGGQDAMRSLITHYDELRPDLMCLSMEGKALPNRRRTKHPHSVLFRSQYAI